MSGVASTKPRPSLDGLAELARLSVDGSNEAIERILSRGAKLRSTWTSRSWVHSMATSSWRPSMVNSEWFELEVGSRIPADQTYCGRMARRQSCLTSFTTQPQTNERPISRSRARPGIGAYVGAPIRLWDGTLYGTLCCLSRSAEPSLNDRDVRFLRVLAEIVADQLDREQLESEKRRLEWSRFARSSIEDQVDIEFQPIFDLLDCRIVLLALSRGSGRSRCVGPRSGSPRRTRSGSAWSSSSRRCGPALSRLDEFPPEVLRLPSMCHLRPRSIRASANCCSTSPAGS